jgi:hypothetical protein
MPCSFLAPSYNIVYLRMLMYRNNFIQNLFSDRDLTVKNKTKCFLMRRGGQPQPLLPALLTDLPTEFARGSSTSDRLPQVGLMWQSVICKKHVGNCRGT